MVNTNAQNDFTQSVKAYYNDLKKYQPIKDKELERELLKQAKEGNLESRNKIINSHLKFVFDVAKKYRGKGVSINDLISEGNEGIIIAIDKFDMSNDTKFITYAVFWIRERMLSLIHSTNDKTYKERCLDTIMSTSIGHKTDDDCITKGDVLFPDSNIQGYDKRLNEIDSLLSTLSPKEKYVIQTSYGINCKAMTLKTLSQDLNLSAERIRQIKLSGIKKMRTYALLHEEYGRFF